MDPNAQQSPPPINQQPPVATSPTPPPKPKPLPILLGVLALILLIGVGIFIAKTVQQKEPAMQKIAHNMASTPTPQIENQTITGEPIILIEQQKLVAIDPVTGKENLLYKIKEEKNEYGRFDSVKWSKDRTKLAYLISTSKSCDTKGDCARLVYELGIITLGKKGSQIVYTLDDDKKTYLSMLGELIWFDWQESSALIYSVNNSRGNSFDPNTDIYRYNLDSQKTTLIRTIQYMSRELPFEVIGNNFYYATTCAGNELNKLLRDDCIYKFNLENTSQIDTVITVRRVTGSLQFFSISPDEKYVLYEKLSSNSVSVQQDIILVTLADNSSKTIKTINDNYRPRPSAFHFGFSSDGKRIVLTHQEGASEGYEGGIQHTLFDGTGNKITEITFNKIKQALGDAPLGNPPIEGGDTSFFNYINSLSFSPDNSKIFLIFSFKNNNSSNESSNFGKYAFMLDADGGNMKKFTIPEEGLNPGEIRGIAW